MSKSKKYTVDGKDYYFTFDKNSKLNGISEVSGSTETPVIPSSALFQDLSTSDDALEALNVNKFKGKTTQTAMEIAPTEELNQAYIERTAKNNNVNLDVQTSDSIQSASVATSSRADASTGYREVLAYPYDIDPLQDHLKIIKYKYARTSVQASRPARRVKETVITGKKTGGFLGIGGKTPKAEVEVQREGDRVYDKMNPLGSVLLPMPKVVDTNGADWGESKLNIFGLAAVSAGQDLGKLGLSEEARKEVEAIRQRVKKDRTSGLKDLAGVTGASAFSKAAALADINIDQNAFLARTSGRVLNPNAELLFNGPVLRDFNFDFSMIARSRVEGETIRKIIRFFKLGIAPQFNTSTFLNTPDVFSLHYKRGMSEVDELDTVNRFSPGGLALRTIAVDYAPSGYWSAYQDSQPVALKMSLNFAELRPIYRGDQEQTPATSVGY